MTTDYIWTSFTWFKKKWGYKFEKSKASPTPSLSYQLPLSSLSLTPATSRCAPPCGHLLRLLRNSGDGAGIRVAGSWERGLRVGGSCVRTFETLPRVDPGLARALREGGGRGELPERQALWRHSLNFPAASEAATGRRAGGRVRRASV